MSGRDPTMPTDGADPHARKRDADPHARKRDADPHARKRAMLRGIRAEVVAAWWLRFKGYRIAARRFSCAGGEIDVIARRGHILAFIEVKYRDDLAAAAEAITAAKRARIGAAARAWLAGHPGDARRDCRFDAMLLRPWRPPRHIADAWRD